MNTVKTNLMEGALIVILVLVLFFGKPKGGFNCCFGHSLIPFICIGNDESVWCKRQPDEPWCH